MEDQKRISRKLKCASQAEILRSHQRDDDFIKQLQEKLVDVLQIFARQKNVLHLIHSDIPYRVLYFVFTSGMGNQTLGEEYTGIVQANLEARKVPSLSARILAAILECFGEKMLLTLLARLQASVNHSHSELTPAATQFLNVVLSNLRTMIPIFISIHKGLFYIFGRYYSLSKRITGVDYAKVYGHQVSNGVSWGLRLLGIATLAQCFLRFWQSSVDSTYGNKYTSMDEKQVSRVCQLCLTSVPTTATPCGHLFCWTCLGDWLRTKSQCPLCREHVPASRIVHMMNL